MRKRCSCGRPKGPAGECAECQRRSSAAKNSGSSSQSTADQQASMQFAGAANGENSAAGERPPEFDTSSATAAAEGIRFFAGRKTACLSPEGLQITLGTAQNDGSVATGQIDVSYKGTDRTRYIDDSGTARLFARGKRIKGEDNKTCDCDCMMYRQFLRGVARVKTAGQPDFQPMTQITSGKYTGTLDGSWFEEDVSTICKNPLHGCGRGPCIDRPGITENAAPGTDVLIRYNFLMQVWDRCQKRPIEERKHTLTIRGDTPPRSIEWSDGWLSTQSVQSVNGPISKAVRFLQSGELLETIKEAF